LNLAFLFRAIELVDQNSFSLKSILFDARRRLRYADPPAAMADKAEERGVKLLNTPNFRDLSSGWLEPGAIYFPADRHPTTYAEILDRLKWMLDCRLDDEAGQYLWEAISLALPASRNSGKNGLYGCDLEDLADFLYTLRRDAPELYVLLMAGRLRQAKTWLAGHSAPHAMFMTRMMSIIWMLFDLQIVSYRLFRAEYAPLDQPLIHARYMTLSSFEKEMRDVKEMAIQCQDAFDACVSYVDLPEELAEFIEESELKAIATMQLLKLSATKPDEDAVLAEVKRMLDRAAKWTRRLERLWSKRTHAFSLGFRRVRKSEYEVHLPTMPQALAFDSGQSSTAIQFGAPSVTLLLFSVMGAVEDLARQPAFVRPDRPDQLKLDSNGPLLDKRARQFLTRQLFTALRDLYARPMNSGRSKIGDDEALNLRKKAIRATLNGREDEGLEPLPAEPEKHPLSPLYLGASAARLMSPGMDKDDHWDRSAAGYRASRIDVATVGKARALANARMSTAIGSNIVETIHRGFGVRLKVGFEGGHPQDG